MPLASPNPPAAHIEWAKYLRAKIPGETVRVVRYGDEDEANSIAIFTSENAEGIVAATIGLMDYNQGQPNSPVLATEILLDARGHSHRVANVAATIGFYIMKNGWKVAPGVTFDDMVSMYEPELLVKHILFVPPFQWSDGMTRVELSDRKVYPLLAVPITDGELQFIKDFGADELQSRWEQKATDVLNWSREGLV